MEVRVTGWKLSRNPIDIAKLIAETLPEMMCSVCYCSTCIYGQADAYFNMFKELKSFIMEVSATF